MIWSIIPQELLFAEAEEEAPIMAEYEGISMLIACDKHCQKGQGRIVQIISSNPQSYLRADLSPGASISLAKCKF